MWRFVAAVACIVVPGVANGQSRAEFRARASISKGTVEAQIRWRDSKKLSVSDEIPKTPRGQGECLSPNGLKEGDTGYLEYWQYEVTQVIGPTDLLISMSNPDVPSLWLSEYPTKDLVDADKVRVVGLIEAKGTKEFTTVLGAKRTVRVIRLLTPKQIEEIEASKKRAEEEKLFRMWASADSNFTVDAKFVAFKDGRVHLEKRDGTVIEVPPFRLSREDQEYYRDLLKKNSKDDPKR